MRLGWRHRPPPHGALPAAAAARPVPQPPLRNPGEGNGGGIGGQREGTGSDRAGCDAVPPAGVPARRPLSHQGLPAGSLPGGRLAPGLRAAHAGACGVRGREGNRPRPPAGNARLPLQVGMRQQWELGQALRRRYRGFLSDTYRRQEVSNRGSGRGVTGTGRGSGSVSAEAAQQRPRCENGKVAGSGMAGE